MPKRYVRRKRKPQDPLEEVRTTKTANNDLDTSGLKPSDIALLRNGQYDPHTMLQLQRTIGNQAIQRLVSYKEYKKDTKAPGKRNHIRGLDKAYKLFLNSMGAMTNAQKVEKMKELIDLADIYLADPKRQKSKRRPGVINLKQDLENEVDNLTSNLEGNEFTDENMIADHGKFGSGQVATVDLLEYGFGIMQQVDDEGIAHDVKVEGDTFEGIFKPDTEKFEMLKHTRAPWTGIKADDLRFSERTVATYELSKLFDSSIIPPTFFAKHQKNGEEVMGTVMEKVQGVEGRKKHQKVADSAAHMYQNDPVYREGVSKLMMFDFIAGQVDRHPGNYMIELKDGEVVGVKGIDNDLSFGDDFIDLTYAGSDDRKKGRDNSQIEERYFQHIAGKRIQDLEGIDKTLAQRIVQVAQNPALVRDALDGLLKDSEIEATLSRLDALAEFLQPLLDANDERIISEWN